MNVAPDNQAQLEDEERPEPEQCPYCGVTLENPCDSLPAYICERAADIFYGDPCEPRTQLQTGARPPTPRSHNKDFNSTT